MRVLVTGGAGFIGSNFVRHMLAQYRDIRVVNLDALTYAGNLENLAGIEKDRRYRFVRGDIASRACVERVFAGERFDAVVNFAAESHVDRSLHVGAESFIRSNVLGVQTLLDACRRRRTGRYVQISTDEVYGSLGPRGAFRESTPLRPNNPYAATKAAADLLVRAAHRSHGLDAVITRCSNNFGPYQFPEKLIPLTIGNALEDQALPVYGDGLHRRDWIYVEDHCEAIDRVLRKGKAGEIYNIGSGCDAPNLRIVKTILRILGKPESLIRFVEDRPGHDRRYAMDAGKIRRELGWKPRHSLEEALRRTVRWYAENRRWRERVRSGAYAKYYRRMYGRRLREAHGA